VPAVHGDNTVGGDGVFGTGRRGVVGVSDDYQGVFGKSRENAGVVGESDNMHAVFGITHSTFAGVFGASDGGGSGVAGECKTGRGVHGVSETGDGVFGQGRRGVVGTSETYQGVYGWSRDNAGVVGESQGMHAVFGITHSTFAGVYGASDAEGSGVAGECKAGRGVHGASETGIGVLGQSVSNDGVRAISISRNGISAEGGHTGIYAKAPVNAGYFEGNIHVTGNITAAGDINLINADCAEDFDIAGLAPVEPGTVMVLGDDGALCPGERAYDKRVAGVISGAGDYKPGIVLDKRSTQGHRSPVALLGKVFCKADASYAPIQVGDLLTTSPSPGHAMKAVDPLQAFGAVIGKALRPLREGQALIPVLIALQ
jgi:hypothetical protein